jgi:hypothetical protein
MEGRDRHEKNDGSQLNSTAAVPRVAAAGFELRRRLSRCRPCRESLMKRLAHEKNAEKARFCENEKHGPKVV